MQRKAIAGLGAILILTGASAAQTGSASGEQQAAAGAQTYAGHCAACHGDKLAGGGGGPALSGEAYWSHWNGHPARALYDEIVSTMPMDAPGSLKPDEAISLVAFLQKVNGGTVPARAIADPNDLDAIKLVKAGSAAVK